MAEPAPPLPEADVVVVGAGAAGMMAALAARGAIGGDGTPRTPPADAPRVLVLDGSSRIGLKILVSGGGRCNVTNERVTDADFDADVPHVVRGLLAAFPAACIRTFLEARGVPLYAEPLGKLFPESDRAEDVLRALLDAMNENGVALVAGTAVTGVARANAGGWIVTLGDGRALTAPRVIVATGGKSLPKTGSTGFGLRARATTRALARRAAPGAHADPARTGGRPGRARGDHGSRDPLARPSRNDAMTRCSEPDSVRSRARRAVSS